MGLFGRRLSRGYAGHEAFGDDGDLFPFGMADGGGATTKAPSSKSVMPAGTIAMGSTVLVRASSPSVASTNHRGVAAGCLGRTLRPLCRPLRGCVPRRPARLRRPLRHRRLGRRLVTRRRLPQPRTRRLMSQARLQLRLVSTAVLTDGDVPDTEQNCACGYGEGGLREDACPCGA